MQRLRQIWNRIRRGAMFALVLLLFLLLQNTVLAEASLLGVRALFLSALVVAVGHFEGGWRGGLFGLAAGVCSDFSGTSPSLLFTILYPIMGFVTGFLTEFLVNRRFYVYAALAVASVFVSSACQMFRLLVTQSGSTFALWGSCLLQTLLSLPFVALAYFICNLIPRRLQ